MRGGLHWRPGSPRLPLRDWARAYDRDTFAADGVAAVIVTLMLVPQSLAYAMLAGLPPEVGLYASVAPLLLYAVFGTSRALAVGPAAITSLMTAQAIGQIAASGSPAYWTAAFTLAGLSGAMLLAMGLLRVGFLANFLSHPVIAGFITASALLIAVGQMKHLLGVPVAATELPGQLLALLRHLPDVHGPTLALGAGALALLLWVRSGLTPLLRRLGVPEVAAGLLGKAGPVAAMVLSTVLVWALDGASHGVKVVGHIPQGLPPLTLPAWDPALWRDLAMPALLISVVGFVESVSVGQTLAARRRERIEPDQELVALGASNLAAGVTGGLPVTGGFARSVVNFDAGARTPAAGVYTALGILAATLFLTPALHHLPQATLAATIVVAVLSLVDGGLLKRTWAYSRSDFAALAATMAATLALGVEAGLVTGVAVSLAAYLYRSSRPHIAVVGRVPGTEHFRNVLRHEVETDPGILSLRVDESLYFANARALEDWINDAVAERPALRHVVLQCSGINSIDASALESLETIHHRLQQAGVALHLSEVKGPVMDGLAGTAFLRHLSGQVFLTHFQAVSALGHVAPADAPTGRPGPVGDA